MADLIDLDRARQAIPNAANTDEPTISTFITAATKAVQRYCRRDFTSQAYDELYSGEGDRRLQLRMYPLVSVQSVRYRPVTALKIQNTQTNTPIARVTVTSTGLSLQTVQDGTSTTNTVNFAGNASMANLATAVNAVGAGWTAAGQGYDHFPSADLYCPMGISGSAGPLPQTQGAMTAAGQFAELKLHTYELAGYQIDARRGWLLRAIPYTDPELLHPEDLIWPVGINNFRVQYTAGYATIPEDVQQATALLVQTMFSERGQNQNYSSYRTVAIAYSRIVDATGDLPRTIKALLKPYRSHTISLTSG